MTPGSESDEEIMGRIRHHEEDALQELLRRYYIRLGEFSFSLLRRRDLAEEAVSNVFLNIWRRRESLVVKTSVRSYLFAAVTNQSHNLRRSQMKPGTVWLEEVPSGELTDHQRTDTNILYRELHEEINRLIDEMPPQRQLVFRMNRIEGLRYWEIASALGISEHTVQNHMVQAVKQLASELPKLREAMERNSTQHPFGTTS